jgi:hypothetical protein
LFRTHKSHAKLSSPTVNSLEVLPPYFSAIFGV